MALPPSSSTPKGHLVLLLRAALTLPTPRKAAHRWRTTVSARSIVISMLSPACISAWAPALFPSLLSGRVKGRLPGAPSSRRNTWAKSLTPMRRSMRSCLTTVSTPSLESISRHWNGFQGRIVPPSSFCSTLSSP
eukprot:3976649-Heterocapsa_arctica.AAC.1